MAVAKRQPALATRRGMLRQGHEPTSSDDRMFRETMTRLLILHELRKSGALTYDEFDLLKARLLRL